MLKVIQSRLILLISRPISLKYTSHSLLNHLKYFSTNKIFHPTPLSSSDSEDTTQVFNSKHVYVSKHYKEIDDTTILSLLEKFKLENKRYASGQIVVKYCPFCQKPHNFQRDNQYTLNIKSNSGAFFCFRCGTKGSWLDFKNLIYNGTEKSNLYDYTKLISPVGGSFETNTSSSFPVSEPKLANESLAFLHTKNLESPEFESTKNYLINKDSESRHLSLESLRKYRVGAGLERFSNEKGEFIEVPVVYFPMFVPRSKKSKQKLLLQQIIFDENSISNIDYMLARNKIRGVGKENKPYQRMDPSPGQWGIFGLNTVNVKNNEIVVTEGEFDAIAVNQATGYQAISLPNGANHLPVQVLPFLEAFTKIYLWMDADEVGQANAKKFAEKLGINRTFIVNSRCLDPEGPKDANDALREDPQSLEKFILLAKAITQENITTFSEMKATVYNKILKFEESQGLKCQSLEWYNKKLKGFRGGEFTIISGLTGSGKTTLLSQLSIDFCKQGVPTLWGSFEIKNETLMTNMLLQYSEANLIKEPQSFEFYANRFENMPLYFMKFFGSSQLDQILSTIEFAIYTYDISHIVIDNLQFLLSGQGRGFEKFDLQDEAVSKFRKLATSKNVHISLVIHPRKVDDTQEINMSSIFGSAKSTQEADNVFLIHNHKGYKVLDLKKNRFDGEVGSIALGFDKETKRFFELYQHEVFDLENEKIKISDIIQRIKKQKNNDEKNESKIVSDKLEDNIKRNQEKNYKFNPMRKNEQAKNENSQQNLHSKPLEIKNEVNKDVKQDLQSEQEIEKNNDKTLQSKSLKIHHTELLEQMQIIPTQIDLKGLEKGSNESLTHKKEKENIDKFIQQVASKTEEQKKEKTYENKSVLEERKKNIRMYNKLEKNETGTFFDEDYKMPKNDEIDEIINNTIKNYSKKK